MSGNWSPLCPLPTARPDRLGRRPFVAAAKFRRFLLLAALSLAATAALLAEPVAVHAQKPPGLGYVFPPAVTIGETTDVQLGGFDFTRDLQWFVHDDQVRLTTLGLPGEYQLPPPPYWVGPRASTNALPIPREVPGRLQVAESAREGLVRWQVANANGASTTAVFYVGNGPEIVERRSRDLPQRLQRLPVAVSGRLSRLTEVDRYEFTAEREGLVSVDLMARRLGADFHGVLRVHDESGQLLADQADTEGVDCGVTFAVRQAGTYTVSLHDADFRGDRAYVYRLALRYGPRVLGTLPAAGTRGTRREVEFVGYGLQSGQPVLESVRSEVAFPDDPRQLACTHALETPVGTVPVTIPLSDMREQASFDPPLALDEQAGAHAITGPLPDVAEGQRHAWRVSEGEFWSVAAESRAIGGRLDIALAVLDPQGKRVAESDDLPGTSDAGLVFRAAASGDYTCIVRSAADQRGTLDEFYRLRLERQTAGFTLTVPQQLQLPLGGKVDVLVQADRQGGFDGPITVSASGLPDGVTPQGEWIIPAGKPSAKLALQSSGNEAVVAAAIQFRGSAQLEDKELSVTATAVAAGNLCPTSPDQNRIPHCLLAITMTAPFEVLVVDRERQRDVHRGTTYLAELEIVRKEGFQGELQIEMSAQQSRNRQGIVGPVLPVPAGATRVFYPCFMPEWLGTDLTRRMVVHGVGAVPDPRGNIRYLTRPGDARITMILEGALLKLSGPSQQITAPPGQTVEIPVSISRSEKLPREVTVELVVPEEVRELLQAEPLTMAPGTEQGVLRIATVADRRLHGPWSLTLTATALQDGKWPVVSQTEVSLEFTGR